MKKLFAELETQSWTSTTREPSSGDSWDRGDSYTDWSIGDTFTVDSKDSYRATPISFTPVSNTPYYAVYAVWSSGDSFGHDENSNFELFGLYEAREEAEKERNRLAADTSHEVPWNGYFEDLTLLEVKEVTLKETE